MLPSGRLAFSWVTRVMMKVVNLLRLLVVVFPWRPHLMKLKRSILTRLMLRRKPRMTVVLLTFRVVWRILKILLLLRLVILDFSILRTRWVKTSSMMKRRFVRRKFRVVILGLNLLIGRTRRLLLMVRGNCNRGRLLSRKRRGRNSVRLTVRRWRNPWKLFLILRLKRVMILPMAFAFRSGLLSESQKFKPLNLLRGVNPVKVILLPRTRKMSGPFLNGRLSGQLLCRMPSEIGPSCRKTDLQNIFSV